MRPSRLCHAVAYIVLGVMLLQIAIIYFISPIFIFSLDIFYSDSPVPPELKPDSAEIEKHHARALASPTNSEYLDQFRYGRQVENALLRTASNLQQPILLNKKPLSEHSNVSPPNIDPNDQFANNISPIHVNRSYFFEYIYRHNEEQEIRNLHLYPNLDVIIAIQVHNRLEYLKLLVESLRRAKDIENTLLVFSHDLYNSNINNLIRSIGFAKVLQIYLPYSQQIFNESFPGKDVQDCPRDVSRFKAEQMKCLNWKSPDTYGHYREASYCQTKHHWFWKANFIFDNIRVYHNFSGPVLFLEEDHYVVEDFLHVLKLMRTLQLQNAQANILCLGTYEKKVEFAPSADLITVGKWISSFHNMGMAFDRIVWESIKKCAEMFCTVDEYNWDWALYNINLNCLPQPMTVMLVSKAPRVFHIGECGVHHKNSHCSPRGKVQEISNILTPQALENLYPSSLKMTNRFFGRIRQVKAFGGWGDFRDHALCRAFSNFTFLRQNVYHLVNERRLLTDTDLWID